MAGLGGIAVFHRYGSGERSGRRARCDRLLPGDIDRGRRATAPDRRLPVVSGLELGEPGTLLDRINALASFWHRLFLEAGEDGADTTRIASVEEELDKLWVRRRVVFARQSNRRMPPELLVDPFERDRTEWVHVAPLC